MDICYEKLCIHLTNSKSNETDYEILNSNSNPHFGGGTSQKHVIHLLNRKQYVFLREMSTVVINQLGLVSDVTEERDSNCILLDNSFDAFIPFGIESNVVYSKDCHSKQEKRTGNIYSAYGPH